MPAKTPAVVSNRSNIKMNSLALPYHGSGMNPNDDDGDKKGNVGKNFFSDVFGALTKDQRKKMAEDFKSF